MRLLNTTTGRLQSFGDPRRVRYAILSHVWATDDPQQETMYQLVQSLSTSKPGEPEPIDHPTFPPKIKSFCEAAKAQGFEFGWADLCCIDRTSSSELSEAITSMYDWYRYADMCLAYLQDVDVDPLADIETRNQKLRKSRWFERGWTLQELLAPSIVLFLSKSWKVIASKRGSATVIADFTKIRRDVLTLEQSLDKVSVACRMSWAASRRTTREEDEAYCLMGIFGVSIRIAYGEGRYAFVRLQEEIIRTIPDQSIFAWGRTMTLDPLERPYRFEPTCDPAVPSTPHPQPIVPYPSYLLASSPVDFRNSSRVIHLSRYEFAERLVLPLESTYQVFTPTAYGIQMRLPLIPIVAKDHGDPFPATRLALLACGESLQDGGSLLALLLCPQAEQFGGGFSVSAVMGNQDLTQTGYLDPMYLQGCYYRVAYLSLQDLHQTRELLKMETIFLPHRPLRSANEKWSDPRIFRSLRQSLDRFRIRLSGWSKTLLSQSGYRLTGGGELIMLQSCRLNLRSTPWLIIASRDVNINIQVGYCPCKFNSLTPVLGMLVWSNSESSMDAERSLEQRSKELENIHRLDHPVHFHSWNFRGGVASTVIKISSTQGLIMVYLTIYHPEEPTGTNHYELGVEIASPPEVDVEYPASSLTARIQEDNQSVVDTVASMSLSPRLSPPDSHARSQALCERSNLVKGENLHVASSSSTPFLPSPPLSTANSRSDNDTTSEPWHRLHRAPNDYLSQESRMSGLQQHSSMPQISRYSPTRSRTVHQPSGSGSFEGSRTRTLGDIGTSPSMDSLTGQFLPSHQSDGYSSDGLPTTSQMPFGLLQNGGEDVVVFGQGGGTSEPEASRGRRPFVDIQARPSRSQTHRARSAPRSGVGHREDASLMQPPAEERAKIDQQSEAKSHNAYPAFLPAADSGAVEVQSSVEDTIAPVPVAYNGLAISESAQGESDQSEGVTPTAGQVENLPGGYGTQKESQRKGGFSLKSILLKLFNSKKIAPS